MVFVLQPDVIVAKRNVKAKGATEKKISLLAVGTVHRSENENLGLHFYTTASKPNGAYGVKHTLWHSLYRRVYLASWEAHVAQLLYVFLHTDGHMMYSDDSLRLWILI